MKIKFWTKAKLDKKRRRRKLLTVAWGNGFTPLAGSNAYYAKKMTLALKFKLFMFKRYSRSFRIAFMGLELHYKA